MSDKIDEILEPIKNHLQEILNLVDKDNIARKNIILTEANEKLNSLIAELRSVNNALTDQLNREQKDWKLILSFPTTERPFNTLECKVIDKSYSEHFMIIECPELKEVKKHDK